MLSGFRAGKANFSAISAGQSPENVGILAGASNKVERLRTADEAGGAVTSSGLVPGDGPEGDIGVGIVSGVLGSDA